MTENSKEKDETYDKNKIDDNRFFYEKTEEEKIFEVEQKLGRYENKNEKIEKRNQKMIKYFLLATNMMYILAGPIVVMLGIYLLLKKYILQKEQPILLVIFLFLGAITGYYSLIKQLTTMNKEEDKERKKENENA